MRKVALLSLLLLTSCGLPIKIPEGFAEVENHHRFDFYAVSADGCYVAVSEFEGAEGADLDYWVECVKRQLTQVRGYRLLEVKEFATNDGESGKTLIFLAVLRGRRYLYSVTLVMDGEDVVCMEATGPEEAMKEHLDEVLAAFQTLS